MPHYSFYEKLLPFIHRQNDPKGVLKAILDGVQIEHDLLREKALALPSLVDLDKSPGNLLSYLAYTIGLELEAGDAETLRREQIRAAVPIYKIKGTDEGYVALLRTLGFEVTVTHLFEDAPDSLNTIDEADAVIGFNQRLLGWHAASKIRIAFNKLASIGDLEINGFSGGLLSQVLLKRILSKVRDITPIHIEPFVVFVWNFEDSLSMEDSVGIAINEFDRLALGSCCYHGKGAYIIGERYAFRFDDVAVHHDDITVRHDVLQGSSLTPMLDSPYAFYDTNYSYHWNYPEYIHDPASPRVWRVCCTRGEENAFNLTRFGYTKTTGTDLQTMAGSNVVTSASSLFQDLEKIEEGDFLNINYEYWRIISVVDNHTLGLDHDVPFSGSFEFTIEWIDSWHRRNAMHKDTMDFTLPAYIRDIMPTYRVLHDVPGFNFDSGFYHDMAGQRHDGCGLEQNEISEFVLQALNSILLEFAYYGRFSPGQDNVPIFEITGATQQFVMPALGTIVGIAISSNKPVVDGSITARPTMDGLPVEVPDLDVTLDMASPEKATANVTFNTNGLIFISGQGIGVALTSDNAFDNDGGDISVSLIVRLT